MNSYIKYINLFRRSTILLIGCLIVSNLVYGENFGNGINGSEGNAVESVSVYLDPITYNAGPLETFTVDIMLAPVQNVMTFTTDLMFNPEVVELTGVTEGSFLNNGGSDQTTFLKTIDNEGGKCVLAITRLTSPASGVSSTVNKSVLTLHFKSKSTGTSNLILSNTGLVEPDGVTTIPVATSHSTVNVVMPNEYADVYFDKTEYYADPDEVITVDIMVGPVEDLMTFTTELSYDPSVVTILSATEGEFLNENGTAQTTFLKNINNATGKCNLAITRLTSPVSGVTSTSSNRLLTLTLKTNNFGSSEIILNNTGLILPDGVSQYVVNTDNFMVNVNIDEDHSTVSFDPDEIIVFPGENFQTSVQVSNVNDLFGVSFDINFDPALVNINSISEAIFLSEDGQTNTVFLKDIDNANGRAVVGITRLNTTTGISTGYPQEMFNIQFSAINSGTGNIYLSNSGLLAPDGVTTYPVLTEKLELNVKSDEAFIRGKITNSATGLPIDGVIVKALNYESSPSDAEGYYELKVAYGYGYELMVMSGSYEPVTISGIHVPESNPEKTVDIQLTPVPIEYTVQDLMPDPNPDVSTVVQGGTLHRYYQVINNYNGNPLSLVPVEVVGTNYYQLIYSDKNGFIDIAIPSHRIGSGEVGDQETFSISSVNNINIDSPLNFITEIESKKYSRYYGGSNFLKLGGAFMFIEASVKLEQGGITTLTVDEANSLLPLEVNISRQGRSTGEIGFKVRSPGVKTELGVVSAGVGAEAGLGVDITGIKEDEYVFPYVSENDYQAIAKYILVADGSYKKLDNTLIRLLTLCESVFSNDATLLEANVSDTWGIEIGPYAEASASAGVEVAKTVGLGVSANVGASANAGIMGKFNHLENQFESSLRLSGEININASAGLKLSTKEESTGNFYDGGLGLSIGMDGRLGLQFTAVLDYNDLTKIKEYRIAILSRNLLNQWEQEIEYRISGDQVMEAIAGLTDEIRNVTDAPISGMSIKVNSNTFQNILAKVFNLINDIQTTADGNASVSYEIKRSDLSKSISFNVGFEASAAVLYANVGAGISFEEGKSMIVERGKWAWGEHFVNQKFDNVIPTVPLSYETVMRDIINEVPKWVRLLMGDFRGLFSREKSAQVQYAISENGSYIDLPPEAVPQDIDSVSVTSWSWYGEASDLKSASVSTRVKEIAEQNRMMAEEIYGMQYGIGGFYQFEPYGTELLDTAILNIKYDPTELGDIDENALGMYYEDKANKKWVYVGGVVDTIDHSVTAPIQQLGLFTLAPSMPYGDFSLYSNPDSIYADSISVATISSSSILNNDSTVIEDGTLFTVGLSHGTVLTSDLDTSFEGIQIASLDGEINFQIRSSHLAGIGEINVTSVIGSASSNSEVVYYDTIAPARPVIKDIITGDGEVVLNWFGNSEEDIAGYVIYYDTDTVAPFNGVHTVYGTESPIIVGTDSTYNLSGLLNDSTYYFAISVYDASGNEGPRSDYISGVPGNVNMNVSLEAGWNIFSAPNYNSPNDLLDVFQTNINNGSLIKIQDEAGRSLEDLGEFGGWTNNIGNISPTEGYKVRLLNEDQVHLNGNAVDYPFAIPLANGWNIIGYPQLQNTNGIDIVQSLIDEGILIKVQDEAGNSIENWGIFGGWQNLIGNFQPGEGYKIKVSAPDTLWILESYPKSLAKVSVSVPTQHFKTGISGNGVDHMNFNLVGLNEDLLTAGDELAIYDGVNCVGAVVLSEEILRNGFVSIAASASDDSGMPGFTEGDGYKVRIWKADSDKELELETTYVQGAEVFTKHESVVLSLENSVLTAIGNMAKQEPAKVSCFPNPFKNELTVEIKLPEDCRTKVFVVTQTGQRITQLLDDANLNRGIHQLKWNAKNGKGGEVAPGVYHIVTDINGIIYKNKVVLTY
ncbi:cohesin domain-containing protein [Draconibacterium sp. IB214405]|uniref:cohesin domain-containing protein n=1 Tax=Draconibacterium sp. IB214405 TaxID=3097352 RepID=UPI002A0AF490|nr:cohesin domain-containing protein [Draconibacterium sp. IB214405]MDX8339286.1 cohesin domain-containing protein [Draconibacterium sp. IB214405]